MPPVEDSGEGVSDPDIARVGGPEVEGGRQSHSSQVGCGSGLSSWVAVETGVGRTFTDQQTLPLQIRTMREYAVKRGWTIAVQTKEVGSGAAQREMRETLLASARRREIDVVLVWRLDRWGRSVADLVSTMEELEHLGVGFVSLTEALDLTTPTGRAMAGLLAVFAEFERDILGERVRAGLANARLNGKRLGRPPVVVHKVAEIRQLHLEGISKSEIARRLRIGRTSVRRFLR